MYLQLATYPCFEWPQSSLSLTNHVLADQVVLSWHLLKDLHLCYYDTNFSFLYRNIRKKDVTKFHVQLALSMLLMLLSYLIAYTFNTDLYILLGQRYCIFVSFHEYTILVVLMWMGAEGLLLFQKLFLIFKKTTTLYIIVVSLICWGESMTKGGHHNAGSIVLNYCYQNLLLYQRTGSYKQTVLPFTAHTVTCFKSLTVFTNQDKFLKHTIANFIWQVLVQYSEVHAQCAQFMHSLELQLY